MKLTLTSAGSYPRIGDPTELQLLRRTITACDRGEKTTTDVAQAEEQMVRAAMDDQVRAGLDFVTDGLIRWHDPISHLAGKLAGVEINGLLRFFDTNFYFRQPVIKDKPVRTAPLVLDEFRFAQANSTRPVKPVLTGPYTLAKFSLVSCEAMKDLETRVMAFAEILAEELAALEEAGAKIIQVDEPAAIKYTGDYAVFERGMHAMILAWNRRRRESSENRGQTSASRQESRSRLAVYVYFRDAGPLYYRLQQLSVDILGLDFTYDPKFIEQVKVTGSSRPLALGLIDGRNTKLEQPEQVARQIEEMLPKLAGDECFLNPSCGLEYLPRDRAYAKLLLLAQVRAALEGKLQ
jgi:5-methyltetrahydropteroyltriglutamate--homocysteine methyltransferase